MGYRIDDVRQEERGLLRWFRELARAGVTGAGGAGDTDDAGGDLLMAVRDGLNARLPG